MITVADAVQSLRPNAEWHLVGDNVEDIVWHTHDVQPLTKVEVDAEIVRLEAEALAERERREAARVSAVAKLSALGLDADEVAAILGGTQ